MTPPDTGMLIARIAIGAALGGIIGYERDRHGRPVGLRTHVIVAMAAATFMVVSEFFYAYQDYPKDAGVEADVSRIAASVVSAIGFLAGGAILRTGFTIQGLTTAAGLWLVTAIGLAAGAGMYVVAATVTAMGMLTLTTMRRFEDKIDDLVRRRVEASLSGAYDPLLMSLQGLGATIDRLEYERQLDAEIVRVTFDLVSPSGLELRRIVDTMEAIPGMLRVRVVSPGHS